MSSTPSVSPATAVVTGPRGSRVAESAILSVGTHLPEGVITNADLEAMVNTSDSWILERTGIRERRRAGSGETASVMGASAGRVALSRAGNPEIDAVIVATSTPDTLFPSTACLVQRRLDLAPSAAFDISAACSGFVYGLSLADSLVAAGRAGHVLLVCADAMTSLIDYTDRTTCVLFGDAAAAVVVGAPRQGDGVLATRWGADGRESDLIYYGPGEAEGQRETEALRMAGRGTFRLAVERLSAVAQQLCGDVGWSLQDVDHVVPHQANLRIIEAAARRLEVDAERLVINGDRVGNTSGSSIPLALGEAHAAGRLRRGDRILALAFGAGATWGGAALTWAADPA